MKMQNSLLNKSLPKWPALLVIGKRITKDQAAEIIIRTQNFYFCTNDKTFERQLLDATNIKYKKKKEYNFVDLDFDSVREAAKKYNCLEIEYLQNHQICTSYVNGPYGWCNWEGNIFCNSFNIGKWPETGIIYEEWKLIAKEFPFLEIKSQLFNEEHCEDNISPIIQFNIKDGKVNVVEPEFLGDVISDINFDIFNANRERGCTLEQYKKALKICENRISQKV